jgi:hypothetical protein
MSSGQSLRNGSSVEPGLPKTFWIPNARSRSSVACLTGTEVPAVLVGWRDNALSLRLRETPQPSLRAKRSDPFCRCIDMDCFVASLLAMTVK